MVAKPQPRTTPDISPEEKARRNAALEQAWRVRAYLPKLRAREEALEHELREIKALVRDEQRAFDDLAWEFDSTPAQIARRDRERAA
jgi:hypothetical protein